jgi:hypothetical protein
VTGRINRNSTVNGKYQNKKKIDHLHSQFGPLSTVGVILSFVIWVRLDLVNQSEHTRVDGALNDAFKLAVDEHARGIPLKAVPHLQSNKYNQIIK